MVLFPYYRHKELTVPSLVVVATCSGDAYVDDDAGSRESREAMKAICASVAEPLVPDRYAVAFRGRTWENIAGGALGDPADGGPGDGGAHGDPADGGPA